MGRFHGAVRGNEGRGVLVVLALALLCAGWGALPTARAAENPSLAAMPPATHPNLHYGEHRRNVLDLWLPDGAQVPVPVVTFIHGGGFVSGDKHQINPLVLEKCLANKVAVAAINYRFITSDPFPASLHDGARAVQFLRFKAGEFNLDPKRIAVYGGSAGGGTSMWIAFHDDLARPDSEDPVARQSSRVACSGAMAGQSSYDPQVMVEWVGRLVLEHPSVLKLYGVGSIDELMNPTAALKARFVECSAITHVTSDDPPIIMFYDGSKEQTVSAVVHSAVFGEKLKEKMDQVGAEAVLHVADGAPAAETMVAFFMRHFSVPLAIPNP